MKTSNKAFDIDSIRAQFPALAQSFDGHPAVFLDGPGGSQVPQSVIGAISRYLSTNNANCGGTFATSRASDAVLAEAHRAVADLLGADDAECVIFGANMSTLTLAMSRSLARTWRRGDNIIVTRLDHDANVSPWTLAAAEAGVEVRPVAFHGVDGTLDVRDLRSKLSPRTRLVAVGAASNSLGTINPLAEIVQAAHAAGALVYVDAVHYVPHRLVDVAAWGADFVVCSAYKFFGPHVGALWGRRALLEELPAYKVRPASNDLPSRWMTGTQNHEGIAGSLAAIEYLAEIGRRTSKDGASLGRREALTAAFEAITAYETDLARHLLAGLAELPKVRVWGIADTARLDERVPTVSITHRALASHELARQLAAAGICVWSGNFYALSVTESLGLEPEGLVRLGLMHYNTHDEIDRVLGTLSSIAE
ncbi:MAG TPA: cysteine desulfurase-like protein [Pirellulales bacterium]|jgi:cysteine desulfurase family protein (TIGR01976 family)|nr:cysteine desulfurase-like protein [Pirellulales bacterium]